MLLYIKQINECVCKPTQLLFTDVHMRSSEFVTNQYILQLSN